MLLEGRHILLGVGGSISACKVPEFVRLLQKNGATVQAMMSAGAEHFVTPLTLAAITGQPVLRNFFDEEEAMVHLKASRRADLVVIAPATANMLAKFACGMADDLLAATVLGSKAPVLIAPAMNVQMWNNPLVRGNVEKIRLAGYSFADPEEGYLACGEEGDGRLADLHRIFFEVMKLVTLQDLKGKRVLLTAGPTRENFDPVRFISNAASGKMGFALAREAYFRGADVTVVAGPVAALSMPSAVKVISVESAVEMHEAVMRRMAKMDIFVANAAVADYRPASFSQKKLKKKKAGISSDFIRNKDILQDAGRRKRRPLIVGFALETENALRNAGLKMKEKNVDLMVVNGIGSLGTDNARVTLMRRGRNFKLPEMTKEMVARNIFNHIVKSF